MNPYWSKHLTEKISFARRNKSFDNSIYQTLKQSPSLVENKVTPEAKKLFSLVGQIGTEVHLLNSFARFEVVDNKILYTKLECKHKTQDLILNHFIERFPTFTVVIESNQVCYVQNNTLGKMKTFKGEFLQVKEKLSSILLPIKNHDDLMDFSDDMWDEFYSGQVISERKNTKLFNKQLPKTYRKQANLKNEMHVASGSKTLSSYF